MIMVALLKDTVIVSLIPSPHINIFGKIAFVNLEIPFQYWMLGITLKPTFGQMGKQLK